MYPGANAYMNILDENILKSQRQILQSWRIPIRQIGYDVGRKKDAEQEIALSWSN